MLCEEAEDVLADGGVAGGRGGLEVGFEGVRRVAAVGEAVGAVGEAGGRGGDGDVGLLRHRGVAEADDRFGGVEEGGDAGRVEGDILRGGVDYDELEMGGHGQ